MAAIRELLDRHEWTSGPGVSVEEITEAEQALGLLPHDYKEFLAEFGWLEFGPYEVYGLGHNKPDHIDVTRMTLLERTQPVVPLPESWVCVMNDGAGNLVSFDTSHVVSGTEGSSMLLWDHELGEDQELDVLAPSFQDWLINVLQEEAL